MKMTDELAYAVAQGIMLDMNTHNTGLLNAWAAINPSETREYLHRWQKMIQDATDAQAAVCSAEKNWGGASFKWPSWVHVGARVRYTPSGGRALPRTDFIVARGINPVVWLRSKARPVPLESVTPYIPRRKAT